MTEADSISPENTASHGVEVQRLVRRLGLHRRRMRYWSGLPTLSGYGPKGRNLQAGVMDAKYEAACEDAMSIAAELAKLGERVEVVDIRATFAVRYNNPTALPILIYPPNS